MYYCGDSILPPFLIVYQYQENHPTLHSITAQKFNHAVATGVENALNMSE
jgi:hypothetical protein